LDMSLCVSILISRLLNSQGSFVLKDDEKIMLLGCCLKTNKILKADFKDQ
jgi:hypothetical protein